MADANVRVTRVLYRGLVRAGKSWMKLNEKAAGFGPREEGSLLRDLERRSVLANSTDWRGDVKSMSEVETMVEAFANARRNNSNEGLLDPLMKIRHESDDFLAQSCVVSGEVGSAQWFGLVGLRRAFRAPASSPEDLQTRMDHGFEVLRHLSMGCRHGHAILECLSPKVKSPLIKFGIGDVLLHREFGWRGVVCGWDEVCEQDDDWLRENSALDKKEHPFYNLLCNDGKMRYGSQLTHDRVEGPLQLLGSVSNTLRDYATDEIKRLFHTFDHHEGAHIPNAHLARRFPEPRWDRLLGAPDDAMWLPPRECPLD
ncbi:hypothetical protein T484DRAFT_1959948 [Baffinella frigidus]|nr:hypothetical protein T484DRAFT_1959948 [Cryptophyta sp. CCMP2293]